MARNKYGKGEAWYIGTQPGKRFLKDFILYLKKEFDLKFNFKDNPGVEITCREDNRDYIYFILNHGNKIAKVDLDNKEYYSILKKNKIRKKVNIKPRDIEILSLKKS